MGMIVGYDCEYSLFGSSHCVALLSIVMLKGYENRNRNKHTQMTTHRSLSSRRR